MSPLHRTIIAMVTMIALQATAAYGLEIEIKGLRLGMPQAEAEAIINPSPIRDDFPSPDFTIAGVPCMFPPNLCFYEGKLDYLVLFFNSKEFENVRDAIKTKYPMLKCETSTVSNAFSASYTQMECTLNGQLGTLTLSRFTRNIETSSLSLFSYRFLKESDDEKKKKQKDL